MATYDLVRKLPLEIESYELEGLKVEASPEFVRRTTVIHLHGGGHEGVGEDVTYSGEDQEALQAEGPTLPLPGSHTLDSFSKLLDRLALFPDGPGMDAFLDYRRWAYESAALDLALRQAGTSLAEAVGREAQPVNFVVSLRIAAAGTRSNPAPARALPAAAVQARPHERVGREAGQGPGGDGRGGHGRPQGRLQGHARRPDR